MSAGILAVLIVLSVLVVVAFVWVQTLRTQNETLRRGAQAAHEEHIAALERASTYAEERIRLATSRVAAQASALEEEVLRAKRHYEQEVARIHASLDEKLVATQLELNGLKRFAQLRENETRVRQDLESAVREADALRAEAKALLDQAKASGEEELRKAAAQAKSTLSRADAILDTATRDAARVVAEAEKRAGIVAGDAYTALRDKVALEAAVTALWNVTNGYGDRYVVPTRSLIDELAEDFGFAEAGLALKAARDRTRRMVELGVASACNYVEEDRRDRANRFVVDAFNGRVEAILSRVRADNFGTLSQEIKDAYSLVNLNGIAFRDARVLPAYLEARLAELRWAVAVSELRLREREEQRRIKEQMREEERARREYEKAMQQAQRDEDIIRQAMEKARLQAELANADQKKQFEQQLASLQEKLTEAEARNQRALSMAQQTRKGNIYIISNVGSFGEEVFKIGMTRRLDPLDRVRELGDASVPFAFDVHAIIPAEDAPALESELHAKFDDVRVNKVNYRKEFFRIPLSRIREDLAQRGIDVSFTLHAVAHEYRESLALSKMSPEEREKYVLRGQAENDLADD